MKKAPVGAGSHPCPRPRRAVIRPGRLATSPRNKAPQERTGQPECGKIRFLDTLSKKSNHVDYTLVTNNYILVETLALLRSRIGIEAVRRFQEDVFPLLSLEFITPETHRLGTAALFSSSKRRLSLVDCISFEVMRENGIRTVFSLDPQFKEQGFEVVP